MFENKGGHNDIALADIVQVFYADTTRILISFYDWIWTD